MIVSALPSITGLFSGPPCDDLPFPLDHRESVTCYNGRAAIWQGTKRLGILPGERVLVPAYCCGSEVDALLKAGLELVFYPLTAALAPELDKIEILIDQPNRPSVFYIIHYCGFAQPLDDILSFARRHNLIVVEDCAQALYASDAAGRPLGSRGDLGVFSLMKSLPLPDGGAYIVNGGERRDIAFPTVSPDPLAVLGKIKHLSQEAARSRFPAGTARVERWVLDPIVAAVKRLTGRHSSKPSSAEIDGFNPMSIMGLDPNRGPWRMSQTSKWLIRRAKHSDILNKRRANYAALADAIHPSPWLKPLFPKVTPGCCPLFFSILLEDAEDSTSLHRHLRADRIFCHRPWSYFHVAMPVEAFPFEMSLKRNCVALPVHQDLGIEDVNRIADSVNRWVAKRSTMSMLSQVGG